MAEPVPAQTQRRLTRLDRAAQTFLAAGLVLGLSDFAAAAARGPVQWWALPADLVLAVAASLAVGTLAVGCCIAARIARERLTPHLAALDVLAVIALALPLALPLPALLVATRGAPPLLATGILIATAVGTGAAAWVAGRTVGSPPEWALGALLASSLFHHVADATRLLERLESGSSLFGFAVVAGATSSVVLAIAIATLLRALDGRAVAPWSKRIALGLGVAAVVLTPALLPVQYSVHRRAALLGATVLLALGLVRRPRLPRRLALALAASALCGVLLLPHLVTPLSATLWSLANRVALGREIASATGMFERGFAELRQELLKLPEAGRGAEADVLATEWNRQDHGLPVDASAMNVLLITIDSLRYDRVGYSGHAPAGITPNLDRMAASAVRFHRCYAQGARTSLSLPTLHWSRLPKDMAFVSVLCAEDMQAYLADELPPGTPVRLILEAPDPTVPEPSLAALFGQRGAATVAVPNDGFGRLLHPRLGFTRGFDEVVYPPEEVTGDALTNAEITDEQTATAAIGALRRVAGRRFFMWVHLFDPHMPNRDREEVPLRGYDGDVMYSDLQVGRLLATLTELRLQDRTVVVVTADHGEGVGDHQELDHGLNVFEESVRIPLLVAVPGLPAADVEKEVGLIDVPPTLLALAQIPIPASMQGFSLVPLLHGEAMERPPVTFETYQTIAGTGRHSVHVVGAVSEHLKVVLDLRTRAIAAFDLDTDPGEITGVLSQDKADRVRALAAWLLGWYGEASERDEGCTPGQ